MSQELLIAQTWHGPEWDALHANAKEIALKRAASVVTALAGHVDPDEPRVIGAYIFYPNKKEVWLSNSGIIGALAKDCGLSVKEFDLALYLASRAGKVCTHKNILRSVWGPGQVEQMQYLRVFISQIRKLLPEAKIVAHPRLGYEWAL